MIFPYRIEFVVRGSKAEPSPIAPEGELDVGYDMPLFRRRSTSPEVTSHFKHVAQRRYRKLRRKHTQNGTQTFIRVVDLSVKPEREVTHIPWAA